MKAFMYLLLGLLTTIIIYLAIGQTLDLTTTTLLPMVNQAGADYSLVEGNFNLINLIFPIIIVLFGMATVIAYLLQSHKMEYEEYVQGERRT